ncbi:acyl-CoA thioesterase [Desulfonatronovibrio hydrogenovorans]|uniref:acyl-CoA thioesterase n=1 Tax=Desulfonatronovibrio hydrogenovorans TaxID=53245 RepID=UPI00048A4AF1
MNPEQTYQINIKATPSDIDELGHVNNIVYLRWVQDAAVAHWQALAPLKEQEKTLWVVLRHEIDYKAPAVEGDEITARTWIGRAKRLSFERNTEIIRKKDQILLARARTIWCPVNPETGKPQRVSQEIRGLFSVEEV